jgi:hypothetical protein
MLGAAGPQDGGAYGDGSAPGLTFSDGGTTGLGFPGVTSYFYLAPGQYDARFVAAGSPECNVPVVAPDAKTLPVLSKEGLLTIGLFADVGADASTGALTVTGFKDDVTLPPDSVIGPGRTALRFINAASGVIAGFGWLRPSEPGDVLNQISPVLASMFSGVPYGQASGPEETTTTPPFVDDNGYVFADLSVEEPLDLGSLEATVSQNESPVPIATISLNPAPGAILTGILLAEGVGDAGDAVLRLMLCVDNAGTWNLGGNCVVGSP